MGIRPVHFLPAPDNPYSAVYFDKGQLWAWFGDPHPREPLNGLRVEQLTEHSGGVSQAVISPDGTHVSWLKDRDGSQNGPWVRQRLEGPIGSEQVIEGLPAGFSKGMMPHFAPGFAEARDGTVAANVCISRHEFGIYVVPAGATEGFCIYGDQPGQTIPVAHDISPDGTHIAVAHYEGSTALRPRLRVFDVRTREPRELSHWDGREDIALRTLGFSPVVGDNRVLGCVEKAGEIGGTLFAWDPTTDEPPRALAEFPTGDITAQWAPAGDHVLIRMQDGSLTRAYQYDMGAGRVRELDTPRGTLDQLWPTKNGEAVYLHTNSTTPLNFGATDRRRSWPISVIPQSGNEVVIRRIPYRPEEYPQYQGGLLEYHCHVPDRTKHGRGPLPLLIRMHGGPYSEDQDRFDPDIEQARQNGFLVVTINYPGTGQGMLWREALHGRPGFAELECIALVYDDLQKRYSIDPERVGIEGTSWGGYDALLAACLMPDLELLSDEQRHDFRQVRQELDEAGLLSIHVGQNLKFAFVIAHVACADLRANEATQAPPVAAGWGPRFGGSPDQSEEVAELYRKACPTTYVHFVTAAMLLSMKRNDPFCPPEQILHFAQLAWANGKTCELIGDGGGHDKTAYAGNWSALTFALKKVGLPQQELSLRPPARPRYSTTLLLENTDQQQRMIDVLSVFSGRRLHDPRQEPDLERSLRNAGRVWLQEQLLLERMFLQADPNEKRLVNEGLHNVRDPDGPFWLRQQLWLWDDITPYGLHRTLASTLQNENNTDGPYTGAWLHMKILEDIGAPDCQREYESYLQLRWRAIDTYSHGPLLRQFKPIPVEAVRDATRQFQRVADSLLVRLPRTGSFDKLSLDVREYFAASRSPIPTSPLPIGQPAGPPSYRRLRRSRSDPGWLRPALDRTVGRRRS